MLNQPIYNIITGERKQNYPTITHNKRFMSIQTIKSIKGTQDAASQNLPNVRKLGKSRDNKQFSYTHIGKDYNPDIYTLQKPLDKQKALKKQHVTQNSLTSFRNTSEKAYNPINLARMRQYQRTRTSMNRVNPVSEFIHQGRMNAPNYSDEFKDKLSENSNGFHRLNNLCNNICEIQKTYGTDRFFRKFK